MQVVLVVAVTEGSVADEVELRLGDVGGGGGGRRPVGAHRGDTVKGHELLRAGGHESCALTAIETAR